MAVGRSPAGATGSTPLDLPLSTMGGFAMKYKPTATKPIRSNTRRMKYLGILVWGTWLK